MFFVGVDLHKRKLSLCVMVQEESQRRVVARRTLPTAAPAIIGEFLHSWTPFQLVGQINGTGPIFIRSTLRGRKRDITD